MQTAHSDFQPALTGARVELRPLRAEDWPAMFAAAADPLIWAGHPARERSEEPAFRAFFDGLQCIKKGPR